MITRLYKITTPTAVYLVESPNRSRAISHVAKREMSIEVALQHEIHTLAKAGVEITLVDGITLSDETRQAINQQCMEV